MLVVFIFEVLSIGLIQLFLEQLHFFVKPVNDIFDLIIDPFFSSLLFLLLLDLPPCVSPSTECFDQHSPVVASFSLNVLDFASLLLDFIFVKHWEWLWQILNGLYSLIKLTYITWHKINLNGLFLQLFWSLNQGLFGGQ